MMYANVAVKRRMLLAGIAGAKADFTTALMIPAAVWTKKESRMTVIFVKGMAVIWYVRTATRTVLIING